MYTHTHTYTCTNCGLQLWPSKSSIASCTQLHSHTQQSQVTHTVTSNKTWFATLADDAFDISHNEQMFVPISCVTADYEIHEDPIGLMQVPKTDSRTFTSALKDVLIRCILPLIQCWGQAFDGAANMSGH